jgi:hypothetical protein
LSADYFIGIAAFYLKFPFDASCNFLHMCKIKLQQSLADCDISKADLKINGFPLHPVLPAAASSYIGPWFLIHVYMERKQTGGFLTNRSHYFGAGLQYLKKSVY